MTYLEKEESLWMLFKLLSVLKLVMVHGKEHQLSAKEAIGGDTVFEKLKTAVIQV